MRQNTLRRFGLAVATAAAMAGPAAANCTFDVPFANGSSQLSGQVQGFLDEFIASNPGLAVRVTGFASPDGAAAANLALSRARAERVAAYLANGGISSTTRAGGETADPGRVARVSTDRCKLPGGGVVAGGGAAGAVGAITPAAAAGAVVGALALGAALSAGGDSSSSTGSTTGTTGTVGTTGTN